ncbi:MAG: hypothetical protein HOP03_05900 [Lysobacter sp.]|nr:hypothetical protein [Lysobacter sp.]
MDVLDLLASCIEQERTAIAPALADMAERGRLEHLQQLGALVPARARVIICPRCEARSVRVIAAGSAFCAECGQVALAVKDMHRLAPDGDWLRRRIAQALDLAGESAWVTIPGRVWRIGDVGQTRNRHRVLFGQQLTDVTVQRALLAVWPTHIGDISVIMITTSRIERVFLPGVQVRLVPLSAAFRVRGGGLVMDEAVWASVQAPSAQRATKPRRGPFAHDFCEVILSGEAAPIPLTRAQAAIFRVLWEMEGASMDRETLMHEAGIELDKPVDVFPRNKYPDANRAYRVLVASDRRGRYRLPRDAPGPSQ